MPARLFAGRKGMLMQLAHFDVHDIVVFEGVFSGGFLATLSPIGFYAEWTAFNTGNDIKNADCNSAGNHENECHRHADDSEHEKQGTTQQLLESIDHCVVWSPEWELYSQGFCE